MVVLVGVEAVELAVLDAVVCSLRSVGTPGARNLRPVPLELEMVPMKFGGMQYARDPRVQRMFNDGGRLFVITRCLFHVKAIAQGCLDQQYMYRCNHYPQYRNLTWCWRL